MMVPRRVGPRALRFRTSPEQFANARACLEYVPATPAGSRDVPRPANTDDSYRAGLRLTPSLGKGEVVSSILTGSTIWAGPDRWSREPAGGGGIAGALAC